MNTLYHPQDNYLIGYEVTKSGFFFQYGSDNGVLVWTDDDAQIQSEQIRYDDFWAANRAYDATRGDYRPYEADPTLSVRADSKIGYEEGFLETDVDIDGPYTTLTDKFGRWAEVLIYRHNEREPFKVG